MVRNLKFGHTFINTHLYVYNNKLWAMKVYVQSYTIINLHVKQNGYNVYMFMNKCRFGYRIQLPSTKIFKLRCIYVYIRVIFAIYVIFFFILI